MKICLKKKTNKKTRKTETKRPKEKKILTAEVEP